ncbi:MAG: Hsp20/alpha crystallin family protein [Desulfomonilia bacterium]
MADRILSSTKRKEKDLHTRRSLDVRPLDVFRDVFRMDVDRIFDDFLTGFGLRSLIDLGGSLDTFTPRIDMSEDEKAIHINAELPGMDEKDIDVNVTTDSVTISGEKRKETERTEDECYCSERTYGSFRRVIPVEDIDLDKVEAVFKKGVLNITLPKHKDSTHSSRKITVKSQ